MLCDRILGNVASADPARFAGKEHDVLDVTWRDCARRAVRGRTRGGSAVGVLLPLGTTLRHGDVLVEDDHRIVSVNLLPCEVWVANCADAASLANAALELGNLHVPVEATADGQLVTPPDGPARGVLDRYAERWRPEVRRFQPLRATVIGTSGNLRLAESFQLKRAAATVTATTAAAGAASQLTNSRE